MRMVLADHDLKLDLLERCKRGEPAAQRELVRGRSAQIFRWAVLLGLQPKDAEDAAQEVLVIALRRIDACRASEALTSWLYQITRRVVANTRRLGWWRRVLLSEAPEEPAFAHPGSAEAEEELDLRRCLGELRHNQAEVLMLIEVEGFTREEAAELLGVPPGTVASRLRLAKEALRERWSERPIAALAGAAGRVS